MSFMYNPFPYDDPKPVNRPELSKETVESVLTGGTQAVVKKMAAQLVEQLKEKKGENLIIGLDGYTTSNWDIFLNILTRECKAKGVVVETLNFYEAAYKDGKDIDEMIDPLLIWDKTIDPTLLYGKVYHGGYKGLLSTVKSTVLKGALELVKRGQEGKIFVVHGYGALIPEFRSFYDVKIFFDVTPKTSILRIRGGKYANLGKKHADEINRVIRRCYYCDFECAVQNRKELLANAGIDWFISSDDNDKIKAIPWAALTEIMGQLVKYPFRCKPVYLEGVWGGEYVRKIRHLPKEMKNCAWVFDFIPMEVSVVVEVGGELIDFNYCTFVHKEGVNLMGQKAVDKYQGYFPIRFNYDDSWHSNGNMSIQCHSGGPYNIEHYNEFGRQDESYYVLVAGHDAKTFIGFRDDADIPEFFKGIEDADTKQIPCDYEKYVSYEESKPGLQVMLPAGTIHSSGRNQVILEIGSLTIGSYTYKMYDYLRLDFDGKQRPIHTKLGEENVNQERRYSEIHNPASKDYIVQEPRIAEQGDGWKEIILGENPQLYFTLRRLDFEKECRQNTKGIFHVLTLVDGERARIRSVEHPERCYIAEYMDMVVVPADMGEYVIENLDRGPICMHKTMLRDGFENDPK